MNDTIVCLLSLVMIITICVVGALQPKFETGFYNRLPGKHEQGAKEMNEIVLRELHKRLRDLILAPDETDPYVYRISGSKYDSLINYLSGVMDAERIEKK